MPWFRLHAEARTDAKLESLPDDEFRVWFRLLCFASEQPERGVVAGYSPRLLAVEVAHGDVALLTRTMASLVELRIIECDYGESQESNSTTFAHWLERQYDKESDWPENTRSRKEVSRSRDVTPSHAMSHQVTPSHAIEKEREEERDPETDTISGEGSSGEREMAPALTLGALALSPSPTPRNNLIALPTPAPAPIPTSVPKPASRPTPKPRAPDVLWDACVVACGGNAPTNDVERGKWNKGLAALRQSGATPEEIGIRAVRYKRRYGEGIALNPMALAGNWTQLATDVTEVHDHGAGNNPGQAAKGNGGNGRSGGAGYRGSNRAANGIKPLPDADYWERYRQQLEREGRLAKPRNSGKLPAV
jgi:hypothetical protein